MGLSWLSVIFICLVMIISSLVCFYFFFPCFPLHVSSQMIHWNSNNYLFCTVVSPSLEWILIFMMLQNLNKFQLKKRWNLVMKACWMDYLKARLVPFTKSYRFLLLLDPLFARLLYWSLLFEQVLQKSKWKWIWKNWEC